MTVDVSAFRRGPATQNLRPVFRESHPSSFAHVTFAPERATPRSAKNWLTFDVVYGLDDLSIRPSPGLAPSAAAVLAVRTSVGPNRGDMTQPAELRIRPRA